MQVCACLLLLLLSWYSTLALNANVLQASILGAYMKPRVNPCLDYYEHACGNWRRVHANKSYYSALDLIDYEADESYAQILERNESDAYEWRFVSLARDYYAACRAVDAYMPQKYLRWVQHAAHISLPTLLPERKSNGKYDWLQVLGVLRRYGLNGVLVEESVFQRGDETHGYIIDIDKPVLNGDFMPLTRLQYNTVLEYTFDSAGDMTRAKQFWPKFHRFELQLQRLSTASNDDKDDAKARIMTLQELQLPWLWRYLQLVLDTEKLSGDTLLRVQNLRYMAALMLLLDKHDSEFICRYLLIRFLWHLHIHSPTKFDRTDCASSTRKALAFALFWLYQQQYAHSDEVAADVAQIFERLRQQFKHTLGRNVNRFDASVQQFLQTKLTHVQLKLENLPRPNTEEQLEQFYAELSISVDDFYGNHLASLHHITRTLHQRLTEAPAIDADAYFHIDEDDMTMSSSSPYYLQYNNIIVVPFTLLQQPMYHLRLSKLYKYSTLGFLLGHELLHGFDLSGLKFDKRGIKRGPGKRIWQNVAFRRHINCLSGSNPNVVDEKIADVSGLRLAYETYFATQVPSVVQARKELHELKRLFFHNFAQFFCYTSNDYIDTSEHGGFRERLLDALQHFDEFASVYGCDKQRQIDERHETCQLWR